MKLIITGATGYLATEVVRQALINNKITSVVALARKPVQISDKSLDTSKLKCVTIDDYLEYPDKVKQEFAGADACIWTVAITPFVARKMDFAEVKKVCHETVVNAIDAMWDAGVSKPFRFIYVSGSGTPRKPEDKAVMFEEYSRMRGGTENYVLNWGASHKGEVEVTVAKPGYIYDGGLSTVVATLMGWSGIAESIWKEEVAAAMVQQVVDGIEKDPLTNDDLVRHGRAALAQQK